MKKSVLIPKSWSAREALAMVDFFQEIIAGIWDRYEIEIAELFVEEERLKLIPEPPENALPDTLDEELENDDYRSDQIPF